MSALIDKYMVRVVINDDKLSRLMDLVAPQTTFLFLPSGLLTPVIPLAPENFALGHPAHDKGAQHPVLRVLQTHVLSPLGAVPGLSTPGVGRPEPRCPFN